MSLHSLRFNALKHHAGFIRAFIKTTRTEDLPYAVGRIGHSQMDFYFGELSCKRIVEEIGLLVHHMAGKDSSELNRWITAGRGFQKLELSDTSQWVLRASAESERYIHIHPGRYSPYTLRVTANTLKTAVALAIWLNQHPTCQPDVEAVNLVRKELLGLSSLSGIRPGGSLVRIMNHLGTLM